MHVVDLSPEHHEVYFHCLEPWAEAISDGVERKRAWFETAKDRGLLVKLAIDDDGEVAGMIQSLPIEHTAIVGEALHFILCIWVHGHEQGIGDRRGHGLGNALLEALEADARAAGAKGMAAWGMALPFWMRASWFRKHGYQKADRNGIAALVWKPFDIAARPPRWSDVSRTPPRVAGQVTVTCLNGGWCTLQNANCMRARKAADASGEGVVFQEIDTSDANVAHEWGQEYAIWVDEKQVGTGPPVTEAAIRKYIERRLHGSWWSRLGS